MSNNLPLPPMTEDKEVNRYLFRLVEQLNNVINTIAPAQAATTSTGMSAAGEGLAITPEVRKAIQDRAAELKALIIKNADDVQAQFDTLTADLQSSYVARSEFGTFEEYMQNQIELTAAGIEQQFSTVSQIVDQFIAVTNGYIRQGVVDYNGITPIIGIAIGQDITVTGSTETVDGKTYDVIDTSHNMSIWTADKLSFYVNGTEVAYFANNSLHVSRITLGDWMIDESNGFAIRWIGG